MNIHPTYPIFPIMIFLSFVASLLPWLWIKRDNIGILFLSLWLAIACLNQFVNSVIWHGNTRNFAPVWCDISTRLMIGITVAIPGSSLCMTRRLYHIFSMRAFLLTPIQKRRALTEDLCICLGIPFLQMAIQYTVEGNRYNILEDIGCYPATYNVWPAYVLYYCWPVIIGLLIAVYSALTIRAASKQGNEIEKFLEDKTQRQHYHRLIILAVFNIFAAAPFASIIMILDLTTFPMIPYIGWEDTHLYYSRVYEFPAVVWRSDSAWNAVMEMCRWILVLCAIFFYGVFGFSGEAINAYKKAFWKVAGLVGVKMGRSSMPQEHLPQ
ncbi:STE3-like pheromone receptor [Rickenella mellea]|uniref:STE3-like pheromone receptor n=1 Tax=Rickenella mellea TaxID=50990 RepID=A0A4Y7PPB0_9AGAM|nr:STE3-like pheromone receptor [Rickenella mellea]